MCKSWRSETPSSTKSTLPIRPLNPIPLLNPKSVVVTGPLAESKRRITSKNLLLIPIPASECACEQVCALWARNQAFIPYSPLIAALEQPPNHKCSRNCTARCQSNQGGTITIHGDRETLGAKKASHSRRGERGGFRTSGNSNSPMAVAAVSSTRLARLRRGGEDEEREASGA